mgnify:CR=1 FL=1
MVILVNMRLKMKCGKIASQCCHASNKAIEKIKIQNKNIYNNWYFNGQKTVVLKSENEDSFLEFKNKAIQNNINAVIIKDMGLTQVDNNSITTMAIGPYYDKDIDKITGHLKLL